MQTHGFIPILRVLVKMSNTLLLHISAFLALLPVSLRVARDGSSRDLTYWLLLAVAIAGPCLLLTVSSGEGWHTDLSTSLWATIAASLILFAATSACIADAWRLSLLFMPYMALLGVFAIAWGHTSIETQTMPLATVGAWVLIHIIVSVATYGLVTIAAVAALAAAVQERALKTKQPSNFARRLPSLSDCDDIVMRLLVMGEVVLGIGLLSGLALQISENDGGFILNHKTLLTITAFVVIGGLLFAHFKSGLRGRKAAQFVLLGYLLLTLGYPGVKFVTDVLLAG